MYYYGYGPEYDMMGGGFGLFGVLFNVLVVIVFVWLLIWAIRTIFGGGRHRRHRWMQMDSAMNILDERFAKGEINKEEYEERKKTLLG